MTKYCFTSEGVGHWRSIMMLVHQPILVPASLWVRINIYPWIYTCAKFYNYQQWTGKDVRCEMHQEKSHGHVNFGSNKHDLAYFFLTWTIFYPCSTQIRDALTYGINPAYCYCSKAIHWLRPTLMLHPSNAAAAWPTFFPCHSSYSASQLQKSSS